MLRILALGKALTVSGNMTKQFLYIFLLIFIRTICCGQEAEKFIITETIDENLKTKIDSFKSKNVDSTFFEDDKFLVTKSCDGEWGGSVKFIYKKNGKKYGCKATCPIVINKINGKYYLTSSLAHLWGSTTILEIDNPKKMKVFRMPKPRSSKNGTRIYYAGDRQSKSTKGTIQLLRKTKTLTLYSFVYREELLHIITDYEKTYLAKIDKNDFVILDTISNSNLRSYNQKVFKLRENKIIIYFENKNAEGIIEINENMINVYREK